MGENVEHDQSGNAVKGLAKINKGTDEQEVLISYSLKYPPYFVDLLKPRPGEIQPG